MYRRLEGRRSRWQRVRDAVAALVTIGDEYQEWRESLPESLANSATTELLDEAINAFDEVVLDLLQRFGRDN